MTKDGSKAFPVDDARLRANLVLESPACLGVPIGPLGHAQPRDEAKA